MLAIVSDMAKHVQQVPEVDFVEPYTQGQTNHAHLYIHLVDRSQRKRSSAQVGVDARKIMQQYRNVTFGVRLPSVLGGENYSPIRAVIRGPDLLQLGGVRQRAEAVRSQ